MGILTINRIAPGRSQVDSFAESKAFLKRTVRHETFQQALENDHWHHHDTREGDVSAKSWCWLFCWAMTGLTSEDARRESRYAFRSIFGPGDFNNVSPDGPFHAFAREMREGKFPDPQAAEERLLEMLKQHGMLNEYGELAF